MCTLVNKCGLDSGSPPKELKVPTKDKNIRYYRLEMRRQRHGEAHCSLSPASLLQHLELTSALLRDWQSNKKKIRDKKHREN